MRVRHTKQKKANPRPVIALVVYHLARSIHRRAGRDTKFTAKNGSENQNRTPYSFGLAPM
jgi:hypothetical protein